ncbi:MAG: acyl carrier protein [Prosthecobacter sp.]
MPFPHPSALDIDEWMSRKIPSHAGPAAAACLAIIVDVLGLPLSELEPSSRFTEDLRADELEPVEIIMAIEDELGLKISDQGASQLGSVADLIAHLAQRIQ